MTHSDEPVTDLLYGLDVRPPLRETLFVALQHVFAVTGTVVTLIGLTLIEVGMVSVGGGYGARADGSFGSVQNLDFICIDLDRASLAGALHDPGSAMWAASTTATSMDAAWWRREG